jgi:hypothetical protein
MTIAKNMKGIELVDKKDCRIRILKKDCIERRFNKIIVTNNDNDQKLKLFKKEDLKTKKDTWENKKTTHEKGFDKRLKKP